MIHTAVILAGRQEKSFDIPVSLIEFDDSVSLLKRSLSLLRDSGVSNIILVTGFGSELFKNLSGMTLVHNDNYLYTSSMASLALAAPYVTEDFLLIESDILFEKELIQELSTTSKKNCFSLAGESGNGDEALVETDGDFIVKISKDIHQLNKIDGEMIGVSKLSLETYKKMLVKWEFNSNPKLNYEYLLLDCTEKYERQYIHFKNLLWCEVDNEKDFAYLKNTLYPKLRRKENPFDYQNIAGHLKSIFPGRDIESTLSVSQIGGMTNRNFKVTLSQENYVLRIPGNGTEGMVERRNEEINTLLSYRLGISPEIFYFNETTGIKLAQFIEGAETLNSATIQRYDSLLQISSIFSKLHNSGVRFNNDFNVFREILNYEHLLSATGASMYEGYIDYRPAVMALAGRLNELGVELKPCHNDLVPENFIKDIHGKIFLIDWEYSGMNDPMWDFAALFLESDFSEENCQFVLERYLGTPVPSRLREKIFIYQILMDILWAIWTCIKEAQGDDFGSYGTMHYNRAITNLKQIIR